MPLYIYIYIYSNLDNAFNHPIQYMVILDAEYEVLIHVKNVLHLFSSRLTLHKLLPKFSIFYALNIYFDITSMPESLATDIRKCTGPTVYKLRVLEMIF